MNTDSDPNALSFYFVELFIGRFLTIVQECHKFIHKGGSDIRIWNETLSYFCSHPSDTFLT